MSTLPVRRRRERAAQFGTGALAVLMMSILIVSGRYTGRSGGSPSLPGPENQVPNQPTITAQPKDTFAILIGSAFSDADGDNHDSTRWQIDTAGFVFSSPKFDLTTGVASLLTRHETAGASVPLLLGGTYKARVQYKDVTGWSAWSDTAQFTTTAFDPYPNKPAGLDSIWTMYGTNGDSVDLRLAGWFESHSLPSGCNGSTGGYFTVPNSQVGGSNPFGRDSVQSIVDCTFTGAGGTTGGAGKFLLYNNGFDRLNPSVADEICKLYWSITFYQPSAGNLTHGGKWWYLAASGGQWNGTYMVENSNFYNGGNGRNIRHTFQGSGGENVYHSLSGVKVFTGADTDKWIQLEGLYTWESSLGSNDAEIDMWKDGTPILYDHGNATYSFAATGSSRLGFVGIAPYNTTNNSVSESTHVLMYVADFHLSGQPCSDAPWSQAP